MNTFFNRCNQKVVMMSCFVSVSNAINTAVSTFFSAVYTPEQEVNMHSIKYR